VRERPILFSAPMVRAVIEGRKTQTRRCIKLTNGVFMQHDFWPSDHQKAPFEGNWPVKIYDTGEEAVRCPYGIPGDRLWVRETFAPHPQSNETVFYKATVDIEKGFPVWSGPWRPSIYMPRWASRILLEITDVSVQRVQEISEEDAEAEGIERSKWEYSCTPYKNYMRGADGYSQMDHSAPTASFMSLWDSINAKRGFGWAENPWVWAISFRRLL